MLDNSNEIDNNFCKGCLYIFKNIKLLNSSSKEKHESSNENLIPDDEIMSEHEQVCKFCLGILNLKNIHSIFEKILSQLDQYEHEDFKITTNFSPLFNIFHTYWKILFKKSKYGGIEYSEIENLDISLIRKVIKPYLVPQMENRMKALDKIEKNSFKLKSDFEIKLIFDFPENLYDKVFEIFCFLPAVKKMGSKKFRPDSSMDRGAINDLVKSCSSDLFFELLNKEKFVFVKEEISIQVELVNANIYIKGNYLKFSREIGQSPWEVNGVKICETSVQDEMKKTISEIFKCDNCVMSAGGREDRDVRMLGTGRPFILEIVNPKIKSIDNLKEVEDKVNQNTNFIKLQNLGYCDKTYYAEVKKYEDSKQKFYTCLVWANKNLDNSDIEKINCVKDLNIIQKTPIRVMHRRTLMDRKKMIFKLDAQLVSENFLIINVLASAGTYIKEFIHSDLGRTSPSLMTILDCECDILQLDVMDIIYEH